MLVFMAGGLPLGIDLKSKPDGRCRDNFTRYAAAGERLRQTLGYAQAPPAEQLLIDQVAICYLRLNIMELSYEAMTRDGL